jgi:hypothetical protein
MKIHRLKRKSITRTAMLVTSLAGAQRPRDLPMCQRVSGG